MAVDEASKMSGLFNFLLMEKGRRESDFVERVCIRKWPYYCNSTGASTITAKRLQQHKHHKHLKHILNTSTSCTFHASEQSSRGVTCCRPAASNTSSLPKQDVHLIEATTTTATSPPCLDELDAKEAGNDPSNAADETEGFNSFPVPAETSVLGVRAEKRTTVDCLVNCLNDKAKRSPPAGGRDKVCKPWNFMSQRWNKPQYAQYNRETCPGLGEDEAFCRPGLFLRIRVKIETNDSSNNL